MTLLQLPFAVLLVTWLLALSSCTAGLSSHHRQYRQGAFCVPDGWQSGRSVILAVTKNSSMPTVTASLGDIIYSSTLQKLLIDDFRPTFGDTEERMTRIYDYPGKILYTVHGDDGDKNHTCVKTPLTTPFKPICMPDNATMTQYKSYYGATQPYIQFFFEFAGKINNEDSDVNYRVSLTREHTTPLFEQVWGQKDGEKFFQTVEYFNSTIWGALPSNIFDPPAICNHVSLTKEPHRTQQGVKETLGPALMLQTTN